MFRILFTIHHIEIAQSIHAQENEHVVMAAIRADEAKRFRLASRADVLPQWPRRGLVDETDGDAGKFILDYSINQSIFD